jgi:transcriptional regulator of aromatic amino acid metabolism
MYTLGTKEGTQANRVIKYLDSKHMDLEYQAKPDGTGHVLFTFPTLEFDQFKGLVVRLKILDGVTLMGVDSKLTEKNIMKLANLINEFAPTTEERNKPKYLEALDAALQSWKRKEYRDDKHRSEMYYEDIKGLVEIWKEELDENKDAGAYDQTNKMVSEDKNSKIRNLIRKTIRQ